MLGYITVKREELKVKDFDRYRGFYCGVCNDIKERSGQLARLALTYDMTFLSILLTSLYEPEIDSKLKRCMLHPIMKKPVHRSIYTEYAADMSIIMVYQNLVDDWIDEKKPLSIIESAAIKKAYKKAAKQYPRQMKAFKKYLKELHKTENEKEPNIDKAANLTGEFFREIFIYDPKDIWSPQLGEIGYYLGKFIYLMDAFEDVDKDKEEGNYNPFIQYKDQREDFDFFAKDVLTIMATRAAAAFERLPIIENADILRNVLYAGIWNKYYSILEKGKKK